jgi:hypothetical protein
VARTTAELLAQLKRFMPSHYWAMEPHLAGVAAMMARADQVSEDLVEASTVGGAEGVWLALLAHGYGVDKVTSEDDRSVRIRIRNPENQVTKPAISEAVNAILNDAGAADGRVANWWEDDVSCWAWNELSTITDGANYCNDCSTGDYWLVFIVIVPMIGAHPGIGSYCDTDGDDNYIDIDCYAGGGDPGVLSPVYDAIIDEVDRIKAAGVRWWLIVDWAGEYL